MTEQELNVLERIWKGQTDWPRDVEPTLQALAAVGYIEILDASAEANASTISVQITDEGSAHLSGSGY